MNVSTRLFIPLLLICLPAAANAQTTYQSKPVHGLKLVITNPKWKTLQTGNAMLDFDFRIQRADGTPVPLPTTVSVPARTRRDQYRWINGEATFGMDIGTPMGPYADSTGLIVNGWTLNNFDPTIEHGGLVTKAVTGEGWHADLLGLNPKSGVAHIEFDVRAPNAPASQVESQSCLMEFDNVPVPTKTGDDENVNLSYQTPWGALVHLKSVWEEAPSANFKGKTQYDFTISEEAPPDNEVIIQRDSTYDNGTKIDDPLNYNQSFKHKGEYHLDAGPLDPAQHQKVKLIFKLTEKSQLRGSSTAWYPLEVQVPLADIPLPPSTAKVSKAENVNIPAAELSWCEDSFEGMAGQSHCLWIKSKNSTSTWRITDAGWKKTSTDVPKVDPQTLAIQKSNIIIRINGTAQIEHLLPGLTSNVNVSSDGKMLHAGETGIRFVSLDFNIPKTPSSITAMPTVHHQTILTFSNIPVPLPGQTIVVNQNAAGSANHELVLHSVKWVVPNQQAKEGDSAQRGLSYSLQLEFACMENDQSKPALSLLFARDNENNSLGGVEQGVIPDTLSPIAAITNRTIFVTQIFTPPHGVNGLLNMFQIRYIKNVSLGLPTRGIQDGA
jgi:hypothetical protein